MGLCYGLSRWLKRSVITLVVLLLTVGLTAQVVAAQTSDYTCFPTCTENDGKMLVSTSGAIYKTLSREPISFFIVSDAPQLTFGIFDADIGGMWDSVTSGPLEATYHLYADPNRTGSPAGKPEVVRLSSLDAGALDNQWYQVTQVQDPAALATDGRYVYLLVVGQVDSATAAAINAFKVRAIGDLTLAPDVVFGFEGSYHPTAQYDGDWNYSFRVEGSPNEDLEEVVVWDGDMDYGDGVNFFDTDDLDTPNTVPAFNKSPDTLPEGAKGAGVPKENNPNLGGVFARGGPVTYELVDPNGVRYLNTNPSGDREWERFSVRWKRHPAGCDATSPNTNRNADFCVDALVPGTWQVNIFGMDQSNVNYFRFGFAAAAGGASSGSIGNTVWADNGDGFFDPATEQGINGVLVKLEGDIDGDGVIDIVRFATTASVAVGPGQFRDGQYQFGNLPAGAYTVTVVAENFGAGGVLEDLGQTVDRSGEAGDGYNRTNPWSVTLADGEIYTRADFGYRGNGSIGNTVWLEVDGNGFFEPQNGELGVADVLVELLDSSGAVIDTRTTDANGSYVFTNLPAGDYTVRVAASNFVAGGALYHATATADQSGSPLDGANRTSPWNVTLAFGEEYVKADFGYLRSICVQGTQDPINTGATLTYLVDPVAGTVTVRAVLRRSFADTAYGPNSKATGWPGTGRKFMQIWTSDNLELTLTNGAGAVAMRFAMDLLSPIGNKKNPSGFETSGIQGGGNNRDGSISIGNPAHVLQVRTSISENLNNTGWIDWVNSPKVDANYNFIDTPQTKPGWNGEWEWDTWYEATVSLSAFGASGFGLPSITHLHSSPSKTGTDQPAVEPCVPTTPPSPKPQACTSKIAATTLRYTGSPIGGAVMVEFIPNSQKQNAMVKVSYMLNGLQAGDVLRQQAQNNYSIDARPGDLGPKMAIRINGVQEVIHTSCSTPYVVDQPAPLDKPTGAPSPNWTVVEFVQK